MERNGSAGCGSVMVTGTVGYIVLSSVSTCASTLALTHALTLASSIDSVAF